MKRLALSLVALAACVELPDYSMPDGFGPGDPIDDPGTVHPGAKSLGIAPIAQETQVWCWLAAAEMIFRHYDIPAVNAQSYQCGIIAAYAGPNSPCYYDCTQCVVGSGNDATAADVIRRYPQVAAQVYPNYGVTQLSNQLTGRVSAAAIQKQIDDGDPVELGITPTGPFQGQAGHAVVIVGYEATADGQFFVELNDPFPYDTTVGPAQNPYYRVGGTAIQPGKYRVDFRALAPLQWSATIAIEPY